MKKGTNFFRRRTAALLLVAAAAVSLAGCCNTAADSGVNDLRCQNLENPEGVAEARLSWRLSSTAEGAAQSAWEVEIASSEKALIQGKADVWKSGKQLSDQQLNIIPQGVTFAESTPYWWRVRIWDENGTEKAWSEPAFFSVGLLNESSWKAQWITADWDECETLPYFRKTFDVPRKPVRAVIYLCGLGCSDLFLNGSLVDETRVLDPAQTNYEHYALYSTFNVTDRIQTGENCVGVMLGDGWYHQDRVWGAWAAYGKPKLRMQMELTYGDGSKEIIGTDESWQWTGGPVLASNIYAGESYDARREIKDWCKSGSPAGAWKNALTTTEALPPVLKPQLMEPIRLHRDREIDAVAMWQDPAGNWIFDFGVNMAAVPRLNVTLPEGTTLRLRMGELKAEDGSIDYSTTGVAATGVVQTDEYTCAGTGTESWTPRFTYHGYRYAELSGSPVKPELSWIKAVPVYTDVAPRGDFECADAQLNKLHELALRTLQSNIHGLPSDCPHRERCGWLGDAHTVAPFASMNYDMQNFWLKYMGDVSSGADVFLENTLFHKLHNSEFYFMDKEKGIPFMIAPGRRLCGVASPDWGTALVQVPWFIYMYDGNPEALALYYNDMKAWVRHICDISEDYIVPFGLGDWCPPGTNSKIDTPIPFSSTAFHYRDVTLMEQIARLLGKTEDAAMYADLKAKIGAAAIAKFYDPKAKTFGSQTADAMALDFGMVPAGDEKAVSDAIVRNVKEKHGGFLHTGIFGLGRFGAALSRYGNAQTAWDVFTKKGRNSFEWMWTEHDATTLWEVLPTDEVSYPSLNHPMQGGYDAWFYEDVAGIRPEAPGYKVIRFAPQQTAQLDWAKASLVSPYGKILSDWKHEGNKLLWDITVPANTSALVALPEGKTLSVNGSAFDQARYPAQTAADGSVLYRFPSGSFRITAE